LTVAVIGAKSTMGEWAVISRQALPYCGRGYSPRIADASGSGVAPARGCLQPGPGSDDPFAMARARVADGLLEVLSGYLGRGDQFDRALANFAERYADENERDYALLKAAADAGQVEVQSV
jgi:hypothetical protein